MALDGTQVRVAGAGHVYVAPPGTVAPADINTALTTAWTDLGYVTEEGVSFTFGRETEDLNAWQADKVRVLTLRAPKNVEYALMQTNSKTLVTALGGGAWEDDGSGSFTFTPPRDDENAVHSMVIEFTDGDISYRYYFPRVQVEGEVSFTLTRSGAVTYPINFGVLAATPPYTIFSNDEALA
jgi:hypothetical protein